MSETRFFVGVDNGLHGAIAVLDAKGGIMHLFPMPNFYVTKTTKTPKGNFKRQGYVDALAICRFFDQWGEMMWRQMSVLIEVPAGSKQAMIAISMADSYATVRTLFQVKGSQVDKRRALQWQKTFWTKPRGCTRDTKDYALEAANKRWPDQSWLASKKCRTAHDGLVDAALIAEYARLKYING